MRRFINGNDDIIFREQVHFSCPALHFIEIDSFLSLWQCCEATVKVAVEEISPTCKTGVLLFQFIFKLSKVKADKVVI